MQALQLQGLFAPFVATLAGMALLLLWKYNRGVQYLPYFAFSLFSFSVAVILSQIVFAKMTFPNALSSSLMYFAASGFMVHAAMSRLGDQLNIPIHLLLMAVDITGRFLILHWSLSSSTYLIYVNAMMGIPPAIGAISLLRHENRDIQSVSLAVAYGFIALMAIFVTPLILAFGEQVTGENYFSSYYWFLLSILSVLGIFIMILSFGFTLGSDLLRMTEENASKDFLSGLLTRRAFDKEANELLTECEDSHTAVSLVMCDIDHFKRVNDHYGHHTGDNVIAAFGRLLLQNMPEGTIAGRTGGEEFCLIMSGHDIRCVRLFAEGVRVAISTLEIEGLPEEKQVTVSFGITVLHSQEQLTPAFKRADKALYEAKNTGRNRVIIFSSGTSEISNRPHASMA